MRNAWFAVFLGLGIGSSLADEAQRFGPFVYDPAIPAVLMLEGEIDVRSPLEFKRALAAAPDATILALNSDGGEVQSALLIAEQVYERRLNTYIPEPLSCSSACAFIFFAGKERLAEGKLGVHQIYGPGDNQIVQLHLSDIVALLGKYGTPTEVFAIMLRTPPTEMYFFTPEELASLGLNRMRDSDPVSTQPSGVQRSEAVAPAAVVAKSEEAIRIVNGLIAAPVRTLSGH